MKSLIGAFAFSLLAGTIAAASANAQTYSQPQTRPQAQMQAPRAQMQAPRTQMQRPAGQYAQNQIPPGSYQSSCTNARMLGGSLIAFCRKPDGTWQTAGVKQVNQCRGEIRNVSGTLNCNRATTMAATTTPTTGYPPPAYGSTTQPGYPPPSSGGTTKPAYPR
jgi:hypothetical protein